MIKLYCDRCGAELPHNNRLGIKVLKPLRETLENTEGIDLAQVDDFSKVVEVDFCPTCCVSLLEWMNLRKAESKKEKA